MTRRGRRRLVLLVALVALLAGAAGGGYALLKWRRAQAIVEARRSGLEAFAEGRHAAVLETLGPYVRTLDEDVEVVLALAASRRAVEAPDGGHLQGAAALYRRAADLDRSDLDSRMALLELLPKLGLLPELIIASDEVLEIDPDNLEALEARVQAFAAMGRWDEAVELAGVLIEDHPNDLRWRQLQVSAAYSAGLDQSEVSELVEAWPATEESRALDLAVRGVMLLQSNNRDAAMDLLEQAVEVGASGPNALRDIAGMLGDVARSDLAFQLFENYIERNGLDPAAAAILADWALVRGEREWMTAVLDTSELETTSRAILASRLALFPILSISGDGERFASVVREALETSSADAFADSPGDMEALVRAVALIERAERGGPDEERDAEVGAVLDELDASSLYQGTLAVAICERLGRPELDELIERSRAGDGSLLVGAVEVRHLERRGRSIEALRRAIEVARRHPTRLEPVVLIATLWGDSPALPVDLEANLVEITGGQSAFDLLSRLRDDLGLGVGIAIPYIRSAIRENAWGEAESAIDEILSSEDARLELLLAVHEMLGASVPELESRVVDALVARSPDDPRVMAIRWRRDGPNGGATIESRREQLPLDSDDPRERRFAWLVLLRDCDDLDAPAFVELAGDALAVNGDSPEVLSTLLGDDRTWSDRELTRSIIDRFVEVVGDSADRDIAEARWAMREGTPEEFDAALAQLDRRFVGGERSLPIAMTMLSMMMSSDDLDAAAIVRLGRQILQDHPQAVEVYPPLISVMQDAGMLEDAEALLGEFESIDVQGVVSGRQRVVQSLRTGDFDDLATTMADIADRTGDPDDLYRLGLARQATGDLDQAERLFLQVLEAGSSEFGAASARTLAGILGDTGRGDRVEAVLAPFSTTLPEGLVEVLVLASAVGNGDEAAVDRLSEIVSRHPELELGWELLARGLVAVGRTRESVAAAREGLDRFPDSRQLARTLIGACLVEPALLPEAASGAGRMDEVVGASLSLLAESLNGGDRLQPDARQVRAGRDLAGEYADELIAWSTAMAIHEAAGQIAECRALAIAAARRFPEATEPAEWRVRSATTLGNIDEAISACRTWRSLSFPNVRVPDETRAALELSRGQGPAALRALEPHTESIVALRERRPGPYRALLAAKLMTGDVRGARRIEGERFASDPASRTTWAKLGTMAPYRAGLEAMSLLEAATPPDPTSRSILVGQWLDFHRRHPDGEGLARARQLVPRDRVEPTDFDSRLQCLAKADIARADGDPRTQQEMLEAVIDSYPTEEVKSLAEVAPEERGEYLMFLQPLIMARNNLAMALLEERRDLERAEQLVTSCLELLPGQPQLQDSHAQILLAMGRMSDAERSIVAALRAAPGEPTILTTAAQVLAATGRIEDANLALQRVRDAIRVEPWPNRELQARVGEVEAMVSGSP